MLNKASLKNELKKIFDDVPEKGEGPSAADKSEDIGKAIQTYLGDAVVGMPPAGTMSGVNFPGAGALPSLIQIPPPSVAAGPLFEATFTSALAIACAASIGEMGGAPIPPGTAIVSEIGFPSIVPVILAGAFSTDDQTSGDAAGKIADAARGAATIAAATHTRPPPEIAGVVAAASRR